MAGTTNQTSLLGTLLPQKQGLSTSTYGDTFPQLNSTTPTPRRDSLPIIGKNSLRLLRTGRPASVYLPLSKPVCTIPRAQDDNDIGSKTNCTDINSSAVNSNNNAINNNNWIEKPKIGFRKLLKQLDIWKPLPPAPKLASQQIDSLPKILPKPVVESDMDMMRTYSKRFKDGSLNCYKPTVDSRDNNNNNIGQSTSAVNLCPTSSSRATAEASIVSEPKVSDDYKDRIKTPRSMTNNGHRRQGSKQNMLPRASIHVPTAATSKTVQPAQQVITQSPLFASFKYTLHIHSSVNDQCVAVKRYVAEFMLKNGIVGTIKGLTEDEKNVEIVLEAAEDHVRKYITELLSRFLFEEADVSIIPQGIQSSGQAVAQNINITIDQDIGNENFTQQDPSIPLWQSHERRKTFSMVEAALQAPSKSSSKRTSQASQQQQSEQQEKRDSSPVDERREEAKRPVTAIDAEDEDVKELSKMLAIKAMNFG